MQLTFIANFYSLILPGQIAGEIVKAYRLGQGRSDAEHIAASVLVDKLIGLFGLLAVAAVGLLASHALIPIEISLSISLFTLFFFVGLFCIKIPIIYQIISYPLKLIIIQWPRFEQRIIQILKILDAWKVFLDSPLRLFFAFLLGVGFQLVCVWIAILFANEMGIDLPFPDWSWILGLVSVAVLLPISIGGIGVREGTFVGILSLQGIPVDKSIALSFAVFSISLIGAIIGGVFEIFNYGPKTHHRS